MKAETINTELEKIYEKQFSKFLKKGLNTTDYSNPLLMKCGDEYVKPDNIKLLFVGRETSAWYYDTDCYDGKGGFDIKKLMDLYGDFRLSRESDKTFFKLACGINSIVNPGKENNFLWTSIFKFDFKQSGRHPLNEVINWEDTNFDIFSKEMKKIKPDFVFFITGGKDSDDNYYIKRVLNDDEIVFIPIKENKNMSAIRSFSGKFNIPMFRIPGLEIKKNDVYNKIVDISSKLVISKDGKVKEY